MKKRYIFVLFAMVLMAWGCQEEIDSTKGKVVPTPGADVKFGASLADEIKTKTIYGAEDLENKAFPILWLAGDQVFIASPQCREEFNKGTFGVPSEADHRAYAGSFIKESGAVQWGSGDADFYAIYPQRDGEYAVETVGEFTSSNATFQLNMPGTQNCMVAAPSGSNASPTMATADMNACFMYAKSADVENGTSPVTLQFSPLSTAIRFTLRGPAADQSSITISRIRLIGPSGAALTGQFQVKLDGATPVVTPVSGKTSNIVNIYAKYANDAYLELATNQSIELNAFIIPVSGLTIDENWKLEVTMSSGTVVTKTLRPTSTATNTNLVAGKIHRLGNMPQMPVEAFNPTNWMTLIPRNVYLSEVSIPGSWNTLEPSAQVIATGSTPTQEGINTINDQYAKGCRGFHFDTRYKWTVASHTETEEYQEQVLHDRSREVWVSFYDKQYQCQACYDHRNIEIEHKSRDISSLNQNDPIYVTKTREITVDDSHPTLGVVQGKGTSKVAAFDNLYFMPSNNITFEEGLEAIIANVKSDEYMVLTCSWAHNSTDPDTRTLNPTYASTWLRDISEACANHTEVYDASTITPNTTVGEVLGKVIVIVNLEHGVNAGYTMPTSSKCLFVNMPQVRTEAMYASGYMSNEYMYKADKSHNGLKIANTLAQICADGNTAFSTARGWAPTYLQATDQREAAGQTILDWAATNFASETYSHDTWQFQGLGGYTVINSSAESGGPGYTGVASVMNSWIDGRIAKMKVYPAEGSDETIYHPVGLIYMNMVTKVQTDINPINGPQTCKNILELNNKFQKKYDETKPAWPEQGASVRSAAPGYSSGVKTGGSALDWDTTE